MEEVKMNRIGLLEILLLVGVIWCAYHLGVYNG